MTLSEYWQADSRPTFHEWQRDLREQNNIGGATRPENMSPIHTLKIRGLYTCVTILFDRLETVV